MKDAEYAVIRALAGTLVLGGGVWGCFMQGHPGETILYGGVQIMALGLLVLVAPNEKAQMEDVDRMKLPDKWRATRSMLVDVLGVGIVLSWVAGAMSREDYVGAGTSLSLAAGLTVWRVRQFRRNRARGAVEL